ncbi:unnamed protein product [Arabidopsis arenosa]|uniref:F-box domain-containing protein n=1 Tax=Arabidopsis arenosa TaxID=38785 RepID=A0A8S2A2K0_ARAAE|nr:unnamed protein product [Arabidopsis arenosa]
MAIISETSDDGSNGGVPNKKSEELHKNPKEEEEENQNEKPKEEDQEDDHQEEEAENLPPIPRRIPQALIRSTVALIRRCHYPSLSLFSKAFRRVISSPELHHRRLSLHLTEPVLYALIGFPSHGFPSWFILNHNIPRNIPLRLSEIGSLPRMNPGSAVVTIGYKILDPWCVQRQIQVYDPNGMFWTPVMGLHNLPNLNYFNLEGEGSFDYIYYFEQLVDFRANMKKKVVQKLLYISDTL